MALPSLVLGLGCRKGIPAPLVATAVEGLLLRHGLEPQALAALATVTEKAQEPALQELARRLGLPLLTFDAAELAAVSTPHPSTAAGERFACAPFSVCEAACLLAARRMAATGMMKAKGGGASPVSRSALKDGPPAGTENGQQTDGTDEAVEIHAPGRFPDGPVRIHFPLHAHLLTHPSQLLVTWM